MIKENYINDFLMNMKYLRYDHTCIVNYVVKQMNLQGIVEAVESWDITSKRSINYKSFNPILHIIRVECPFPCKLWAVWALTNLCECKPKRYVKRILIRYLRITVQKQESYFYGADRLFLS